MLIFWKARLVLLAVPKTGTTALEETLAPFADAAIVNPPGLKHCSVAKYRREVAGFFERGGARPLDLVAVMREPVSWLGSWFRYRSRPELAGHANFAGDVDFERFVTGYLAEPQPDFARVGSQARFLSGGVDHLFRHDRMADLVGFLSGRLEREFELPRRNVSPEGTLHLPEALSSRLRDARRDDFDLWEKLTSPVSDAR